MGYANPPKVTKPRAQKSESQAEDIPKIQGEDAGTSISILEVTEKMADVSIGRPPILSPVGPSDLVTIKNSQKPDKGASSLAEVLQKTTKTPVEKPKSTSQNDNASTSSSNIASESDHQKANVASLTDALEKATETPLQKPSTPPRPFNPFDSELASEPDYEKTPGRLGRIGHTDFSLKPDIKPFKGPKGQKERKSHEEIEEEWGQFALDNENASFHEYAFPVVLFDSINADVVGFMCVSRKDLLDHPPTIKLDSSSISTRWHTGCILAPTVNQR